MASSLYTLCIYFINLFYFILFSTILICKGTKLSPIVIIFVEVCLVSSPGHRSFPHSMKKNINIKKLRDKIKPLLLNAVITFHASESLKFVEISSLCKEMIFCIQSKIKTPVGNLTI